MLNALSAHIAVLDGAGRILSVNEAWRRFGRENGWRDPAYGVGSSYLEVCDRAADRGDERAAAVAAGLRALAAGGPELVLEYPCHGPAERRWYMLRATRFEAAGETRIAVAHENVTARKLAEERLERRGRALEALNAISVAISAELDRDRLVQLVVDGARELVGAAFGAFFHNVVDPSGESYMLYTLSGVPREAFAGFPMPRNTAVFAPTFRGEGVVRSDDITKDPRYGRNAPYRGMPKGHLPVRSYLAAPVVGRSGEVAGGLFFGHPDPCVFGELAEQLLVGIAAQAAVALENAELYHAARREIEERRRAEETQALLLAELNHRVKNTLAVVGSVARASFADSRTLDEGREALSARLQALARAHELLTASGWRGGSLSAMVKAVVGPYDGRAEVAGDELILLPHATQSLGLILHELATNAAKHGSLSVPAGRVRVAWAVEQERFHLSWRESGGPPVASPGRSGFGRLLLERAAAHDLGGHGRLEFRPEGLGYELEASLARVLADAARAP